MKWRTDRSSPVKYSSLKFERSAHKGSMLREEKMDICVSVTDVAVMRLLCSFSTVGNINLVFKYEGFMGKNFLFIFLFTINSPLRI